MKWLGLKHQKMTVPQARTGAGTMGLQQTCPLENAALYLLSVSTALAA